MKGNILRITKRQIPNTLSCLRIILSIFLLFIIDTPMLFFAVYVVCGITDIVDGYIARHYNAETKLGSMLDSLGDLVFCTVVLYFLLFRIYIKIDSMTVLGVVVVATIRMVNIVITKVKFKRWGIIHTLGNKFTGLLIFTSIPFVFVVGYIPFFIGIPVFVVAFLSSIEEGAILLSSTSYDANRKGIFKCFLHLRQDRSGEKLN